MLVKIRNTTNEEMILLETLLREDGSGSETYEIPKTSIKNWSNDATVLSKILDGSVIVSINNEDITDAVKAINILKDTPTDYDQTGRPIVRYAATIRGWHYQAHSVQFEINKLNSIYNKDVNGNDLGIASIKVYRANGTECTTQVEADSYGVKTIVKWAPSYDFEIVSGNIRQASKETIDSYIYVQAQVYTGLAAPYDFLRVPFSEGGINLKYIGADEILKTDGRASKLIKGSNGDHFEIVANYPSGILSGNNHEMSVIFEIYKDPTS